jgi:hypothetical protein
MKGEAFPQILFLRRDKILARNMSTGNLDCDEVLPSEDALFDYQRGDCETSATYLYKVDLGGDPIPLADLFLAADDTDQLVRGAVLGLCALKRDSPPSTPKMIGAACTTPIKAPGPRHSARKRTQTYDCTALLSMQ